MSGLCRCIRKGVSMICPCVNSPEEQNRKALMEYHRNLRMRHGHGGHGYGGVPQRYNNSNDESVNWTQGYQQPQGYQQQQQAPAVINLTGNNSPKAKKENKARTQQPTYTGSVVPSVVVAQPLNTTRTTGKSKNERKSRKQRKNRKTLRRRR